MSVAAEGQPALLRLEVPADATQLPELRCSADGWLRGNKVPRERRERITLAMSEAVTNSIVHAYRDGADGPVIVQLRHLADGTVELTVIDYGNWRPAIAGRDSGGRGVLIMQESADDVRIDTTESGTRVRIIVEPHALAEAATRAQARHSIGVRNDDQHVIARVTGDVAEVDAVLLRRQLLAATCGGLVPLTVDLSGLDSVSESAQQAIRDAARAADGVGGRVRVVAPSERAQG